MALSFALVFLLGGLMFWNVAFMFSEDLKQKDWLNISIRALVILFSVAFAYRIFSQV